MAAKVSLLGMMTEKEKERILAKCDGDIFGNECVMPSLKSGLKRGHCTVKGNQHPKVSFRGRQVGLARLLYYNFGASKISKEKPWVLHKCDTNGRCVCIKHLYAGSPGENTNDCKGHGNLHKLPRPPRTKLSPDDVRAIRERISKGNVSQKDIAREFGLDPSTISHIKRRTCWKEVR